MIIARNLAKARPGRGVCCRKLLRACIVCGCHPLHSAISQADFDTARVIPAGEQVLYRALNFSASGLVLLEYD